MSIMQFLGSRIKIQFWFVQVSINVCKHLLFEHNWIYQYPSHQFGTLLTQGPIPEIFAKKIFRIGSYKKLNFLSQPFWFFFFSSRKKYFFCFFPMKISQSLLVSKDGSKFWSSQTWQHFLTHTKHSWGECTICPLFNFFFKAHYGPDLIKVRLLTPGSLRPYIWQKSLPSKRLLTPGPRDAK